MGALGAVSFPFTDTDPDAVVNRSALPHRFLTSLAHGAVNHGRHRAAFSVHKPRVIPRIVLARLKDGTISEGSRVGGRRRKSEDRAAFQV